MRKKRFLFNLIILCILASIYSNCKNSKPPDLSLLKRPIILKGQKIELPETFSAIDLKIVDSLLVILTYGDPLKFHVYNKNTLKFIGKFGSEGRGPSEYLLPSIMSQKIRISDSSFILIYDNTLGRLNYVNLLEAINKTNYYPKSISFHDRKISQVDILGSAVVTADSFIVGTSNTSNSGKFFCYDIYKNNMIWEPYYPTTRIAPRKGFQDDLYKTHLTLRPNSGDIAAASLFFKRIDILDKKGKLKRSIVFENQNKEPDFSNANSWPPKGAHEYFTSISSTQSLIYALDIDLKVDNREIIDTVSLIKTTWEDLGTPPVLFKLTPKILKMDVDEENNKIFGIELFSSFIYLYEMNQPLDKYRK